MSLAAEAHDSVGLKRVVNEVEWNKTLMNTTLDEHHEPIFESTLGGPSDVTTFSESQIHRWIDAVDSGKSSIVELAKKHGFSQHRQLFSAWRTRLGRPAPSRNRWTDRQIIGFIDRVDAGRTSIAALSRQHGFNVSTFNSWRRRFNRPATKRPHRTIAEIVKLIDQADRGATVSELAALHGFDPKAFPGWRKRAKRPAPRLGPPGMSSARKNQILGFIDEVDGGVKIGAICEREGFSQGSFWQWRKRFGRTVSRAHLSGATSLDFELAPGSGQVQMTTKLRPELKIKVAVPAQVFARLRKACGDGPYTSSATAIVLWSLQDLRAQKKKLIISDARDNGAKPGRGHAGAEHLHFELRPGRGEVRMLTKVRAGHPVKLPITQSDYNRLGVAAGHKLYTSSAGALIEWALIELKRRGKRLVVRRGAAGK